MGFVIFFFIIGILIMIHEWGHFISAKKLGVKVEKFSLGFGNTILRYKKNDTEYSLGWIPFGGYVKLAGDNREEYKGLPYEYLSQSISKRFLIVFAGPFLNYLLALFIFWFIYFIGYPTFTTTVGGVIGGFGAQEAGIKPGDKILSVENKKVKSWEELQKLVRRKKPGERITLDILREGKEYRIEVLLRQKELIDELGRPYKVSLLGIIPTDQITKVRYRFFESFWLAINKTFNITLITCRAIFNIIRGKMDIRKTITGPLGIFYITSETTKLGWVMVFHLLAVLSMSLFIFNLLPFPVLDGGHIFFLFLEKIRKKPLGVKTEKIINQLGFIFIIILGIYVTLNDILRLWEEKIKLK